VGVAGFGDAGFSGNVPGPMTSETGSEETPFAVPCTVIRAATRGYSGRRNPTMK